MDTTIRSYTTKSGSRLEYSMAGKGKPILLLHGGHSNCREELLSDELVQRGYFVIIPSRPGYGTTSKELGGSISSACDAYRELLDELCLDRVHLISISAGGPSGISFAAAYPERVRSLVLQSAVTRRWMTSDDKLYKSAQILFRPTNEKFTWAIMRMMNRLFPQFIFKSMLSSFSTLPTAEALRVIGDLDRKRFSNMLNLQRSGHGFMIDLEQTGWDWNRELASIQCPTLIMHSINDASVSIEHARHAARLIPRAQLCELHSWGHLIWIGQGSPSINDKLQAFLDNIEAEN